jgi:hypothetical protein
MIRLVTSRFGLMFVLAGLGAAISALAFHISPGLGALAGMGAWVSLDGAMQPPKPSRPGAGSDDAGKAIRDSAIDDLVAAHLRGDISMDARNAGIHHLWELPTKQSQGQRRRTMGGPNE